MLVPALGLGTAAVWNLIGVFRVTYEKRLEDTARALGLALDREIGVYQSALVALSGSTSLDGQDPALGTFETEARRTALAVATSLTLLDPTTMRQLINTSLAPGEKAAAVSAADLAAVSATGRPLITNLVLGAQSQRPVVGIAVPVTRDGRVRFILAARIEPARLSRVLTERRQSDAGFDVLVDASNTVVARSRDLPQFLGKQAPGWFSKGTEGREFGFLRGAALEQRDVVVGFARLTSTPGWTIVVAEPWSDYAASWSWPLVAFALGGGIIVIFGVILAIWTSRRLLRSVATLVSEARIVSAIHTGEAISLPTPAVPALRVAEFDELYQPA